MLFYTSYVCVWDKFGSGMIYVCIEWNYANIQQCMGMCVYEVKIYYTKLFYG